MPIRSFLAMLPVAMIAAAHAQSTPGAAPSATVAATAPLGDASGPSPAQVSAIATQPAVLPPTVMPTTGSGDGAAPPIAGSAPSGDGASGDADSWFLRYGQTLHRAE